MHLTLNAVTIILSIYVFSLLFNYFFDDSCTVTTDAPRWRNILKLSADGKDFILWNIFFFYVLIGQVNTDFSNSVLKILTLYFILTIHRFYITISLFRGFNQCLDFNSKDSLYFYVELVSYLTSLIVTHKTKGLRFYSEVWSYSYDKDSDYLDSPWLRYNYFRVLQWNVFDRFDVLVTRIFLIFLIFLFFII